MAAPISWASMVSLHFLLVMSSISSMLMVSLQCALMGRAT